MPRNSAEARYVDAAQAANNLRGYRSGWREFTAWPGCGLPARLTPDHVVTAASHTTGQLRQSSRITLTGQQRIHELLRGRRHSHLRYEHDWPGSLLHVDVKKLGKIPPGGGHRAHGRSEDVRPVAVRAGTTSTSRSTTTAAWPTPKCCPTRRP